MTRKSYFDGGLLQLIGWKLLGGLITVLTLGICYPWACCMVYNWEIKHTVINGKRLKFDGKAIQLFGNWIKWWILTILTIGIYGLWLGISLKKWKTKHTYFEKTSNTITSINSTTNNDFSINYGNKSREILVEENKNTKEDNKTISSWSLLGIFLLLMLIPFSIYCLSNGISGLLDMDKENVNNSNFSNSNIVDKILGEKILTCTKTETDEDGYESNETVAVTYKNNNVTKYESSTISKTNPESMEFTLSVSQGLASIFSEIDGVTMEVSKVTDDSYKVSTKIIYDELNKEQIKKIMSENSSEEAIEDYNLYKKNVNINDLKDELSKEYKCN